MRAPISVVIPTLNAANSLPACLAALVEALDAGLIRELVISDGESKDETLALADAWGATIVSGPASRGGQLRRGCEAAKGDWFLILHADTVLSEGWSDKAQSHFRTNKAGWFRLRFDRGGRAIAAWANIRSRWGLPYGDQGLLLPASLYHEVGGYSDIPLMEDVALARALKGKLTEFPAVALTSAERYRKQGWIKRSARNFWTLVRYFAGVSPHELARRYNRQ